MNESGSGSVLLIRDPRPLFFSAEGEVDEMRTVRVLSLGGVFGSQYPSAVLTLPGLSFDEAHRLLAPVWKVYESHLMPARVGVTYVNLDGKRSTPSSEACEYRIKVFCGSFWLLGGPQLPQGIPDARYWQVILETLGITLSFGMPLAPLEKILAKGAFHTTTSAPPSFAVIRPDRSFKDGFSARVSAAGSPAAG